MYTQNKQAMSPEIIKTIDNAGVMAVLVIDDVRHAVPVAKALLAGGVTAIELTLRTPAAYEAAKLIKKEVPEMTLGFGTVISTEQVKAVVDLGADFAVAPGCNPKVIAEAVKQGLNFGPGIMTPTDIEMAINEGCRILKLFPAETSGGLAHLESMVAPYQYLDLKFIPLGGCNISNARTYLESPLITAIGGSWIAKRDMIQAENWELITRNAREISTLIANIRNT
ncbi:MAG: bifunctional 4-hydroxy-2-oxoglutarate aldolase/2-dehydro-3-deoxy-phosphogluconate aldolase [Bacteroidales bacterium]|nr:bifunctional 4-hydroxy-2-oxoglutarate aldolase/2-dehydro-3-deoxy-phosphogluconate aldolase [Bacteroidales bacterium]